MIYLRNFILIFVFSMMPCIYGMRQTPVTDAVQAHDIVQVQALLDAGANVNEQDAAGITPLIAAVYGDINVDIIKLLLKKGADPNLRDRFSNALYHLVALGKKFGETNKEVAKMLLAAGANPSAIHAWAMENPNYPASLSVTPLYEAVRSEHYYHGILSLFFKANLLFGVRGDLKLEEMHHRGKGQKYEYYMDKYLVAPFDKVVHYISNAPAVSIGYSQRLKSVLRDIPINQQDELGATLLMYAAGSGNVPAVRYLLGEESDPLVRTYNGRTARSIVQHILGYTNLEPKQRKSYTEILQLLNEPIFKKYRTVRLLEKPIEGLPALSKDVIRYMYPFVKGSYLPPRTPPGGQPPAGGVPAAPGAFVPPGVAVPVAQQGVARNAPTLFNRRNLIIAALTALSGYSLYQYLTPQEIPTNLDKDELAVQLITALTSKNFEYAYRLAKKNPEALREIAADKIAESDFVELIRETRDNLFRESAEAAESWNPFDYYWRPSLIIQFKYLADLLYALEKSAH